MPRMSANCQAIARTCFLSSLISCSFCSGDRFALMMTGNWQSFPRNAYSKWSGSSFRVSSGGSLYEVVIRLEAGSMCAGAVMGVNVAF
ncbi:hypothetical protein LINPERHAP1_LOCUS36354, partial [Linum perenne]